MLGGYGKPSACQVPDQQRLGEHQNLPRPVLAVLIVVPRLRTRRKSRTLLPHPRQLASLPGRRCPPLAWQVSNETGRQLELDAFEASGITSQVSDDKGWPVLGFEPPRPGEHCLATDQVGGLVGLSGNGPTDHPRLMPDADD